MTRINDDSTLSELLRAANAAGITPGEMLTRADSFHDGRAERDRLETIAAIG